MKSSNLIYKKIIFSGFLLISLYSCTDKKDHVDNEWIGKELIVPEVPANEKKVVVRVLGDCPACIETFESWKAVNDAMKHFNSDLKLVFYVEVIKEEKFKELEAMLSFADYVIFDQRGAFYAKNLLNFPYNLEDHAFLLNEKNEIMIFGNPAIKKDLIVKYIEKI